MSATTVAQPPGPPFSLVGLLSLVRRSSPPARFVALTRDYPRIASLGLGRQRVFLVTDPELARQVLVGSARSVEKGPALRAAGLVLGDGLLTLPNDVHRPRRRLVNPSFHHTRLAGYAEVMTEATDELDGAWVEGTRVDMAQEMSGLALRIVSRALFGDDLGGAANEVYRDLDRAMAGWEKLMLPGGAQLMNLPLPVFRRMWAAAASLDRVVHRLVQRATDRPGDDVVSQLLAARVDGDQLPDQAVRDEAMTLLLAGHETTANALAWLWHLLSGHPEAAARLRAEVAALPGPPTYDALRQLPYTMGCVAEVLRLYPPAWALEREVATELELDGYRLPVGSIVLVSQYALHRDPRWWEQPEEFRPQRWLTAEGAFSEDAPGQPRGAWFPFGSGSRVCIGESFAWTEVALVVARLARRWAPRTDPRWRPKLHAAVTLRPHGGLPMTLERAQPGRATPIGLG